MGRVECASAVFNALRDLIHLGHTIDYAVRVLVWRKLVKDDVDELRWKSIISSLLDRHGRLGNDSEVCWLLFAANILQVGIPDDVALTVVQNCGALSIVSIMNSSGFNQKAVFDQLFELVSSESSDGAMWPVFLEWSGSGWHRNDEVKKLVTNDTLNAMVAQSVYLFDIDRLTRVFKGVEASKFVDISHAIEHRVSFYDDDDSEDEDITF